MVGAGATHGRWGTAVARFGPNDSSYGDSAYRAAGWHGWGGARRIATVQPPLPLTALSYAVHAWRGESGDVRGLVLV